MLFRSKLSRAGTLAGAANFAVLALGRGIIRVQNDTATRRTAKFGKVKLGAMQPGEIATWRVTGNKARRVAVAET